MADDHTEAAVGVPETGIRMAQLDEPTAPTSTRLAVLADPHIATEATGTLKCYHRTEMFFERAVEGVRSANPDAVVVAGDLTKDGEAHNVDRYEELAAPLSEPLVIPGNHDVPKTYVDHDVMAIERFAARYTDSGYPFHEHVGGLDLYGLNSATLPDGSLRETWGGELSARQLSWLDEKLARDSERASTPVVLVHHNVFDQPEHDREFGGNFQLANSEQLLDCLVDHAPVLVVSGHHHISSIHSTAGVSEIISPAVCSYPQSYLLVDVGPDGTSIRRVPLLTSSERAESYMLGVTGSEFEQGILDIATARIRDEPLQ
jgi:3',5'-cyclic AMP phosphodiesterase CpdA